MKRNPLLLLVLAVFLALLSPRPARASVSFDFFYDNLSPHGEWVEAEGYGTCWRPSGIDQDWAPYTDGYWVYTDAGWTWSSYEDFGSITYHYGRWVRIDGYGWIWKPDYEWAPAWVSWRYSDDYVGWAPLPPEAYWDASVGISVWADRDYDIGPSYYSFCETRHFGSPVIRNVLLGRSLNISFISRTVNITNISYNRDRSWVYCGGPDYRKISHKSNRRIETLKLERRTQWDQKGGMQRSHRKGNDFIVHAPVIDRSKSASKKPHVSRRIEKSKVDRGWNGIANDSGRKQTRAKYEAETKGLSRKNAPARQMDARDFSTAVAAKNDRDRREEVRKGDKNPQRPQPKEADRTRKENTLDRPRNEKPGEGQGRQDTQRPQRQPEQKERQQSEASKPEKQQQRPQEDRSRQEQDQQRQRNEEREQQRKQEDRARRDQQQQAQRNQERERQRNDQRNAEKQQQQRQQEDRARRDQQQQAQRNQERERQRNDQRNAERQQQQQRQQAEPRKQEQRQQRAGGDQRREQSQKKDRSSSQDGRERKKKDDR